jgi:hypothetical protein
MFVGSIAPKAGMILVGSLFICACGAGGDGPEAEPGGCTEAPLRKDPVLGALEIGIGGPTNFRALPDGASHDLVLGSQGGWMPAPVFRIDAEAFGTDGECAFIDVDANVEGFAPRNYHFAVPKQPEDDPFWYVGSLPLFLSTEIDDVLGRSCMISATFSDDGVSASAEVTVMLVNVN